MMGPLRQILPPGMTAVIAGKINVLFVELDVDVGAPALLAGLRGMMGMRSVMSVFSHGCLHPCNMLR